MPCSADGRGTGNRHGRCANGRGSSADHRGSDPADDRHAARGHDQPLDRPRRRRVRRVHAERVGGLDRDARVRIRTRRRNGRRRRGRRAGAAVGVPVAGHRRLRGPDAARAAAPRVVSRPGRGHDDHRRRPRLECGADRRRAPRVGDDGRHRHDPSGPLLVAPVRRPDAGRADGRERRHVHGPEPGHPRRARPCRGHPRDGRRRGGVRAHATVSLVSAVLVATIRTEWIAPSVAVDAGHGHAAASSRRRPSRARRPRAVAGPAARRLARRRSGRADRRASAAPAACRRPDDRRADRGGQHDRGRTRRDRRRPRARAARDRRGRRGDPRLGGRRRRPDRGRDRGGAGGPAAPRGTLRGRPHPVGRAAGDRRGPAAAAPGRSSCSSSAGSAGA